MVVKLRITQVFIFLLVISCTNHNQRFEQHNSDNLVFQVKFNPKLDKQYIFQNSSTTIVEQEVNSEAVISENKLDSKVAYYFSPNSSGSLNADVKYIQFKLFAKTGEIEKEFDAANILGSSNVSEKIFSVFNDAELKFVIDSVGNVQLLSGHKELIEKMYKIADGNPEALQMLNGSIRQYVTEGFFKQAAEQNLKIFSNRPLKIGDTIQHSNSLNAGIKFKTETVYKLTSVVDGTATIETVANVDISKQELEVEGQKVIASLNGKQEGELKINIATGLIQNSNSLLKIKGNLEVMGRDIPIKITMENSIRQIKH